jgi:hypothetical protein
MVFNAVFKKISVILWQSVGTVILWQSVGTVILWQSVGTVILWQSVGTDYTLITTAHIQV